MTVTRWRKSSRSGSQGECVELAHTLDAVRDTKNPHGPTLAFVHPVLPGMLAAIKTGRLHP